MEVTDLRSLLFALVRTAGFGAHRGFGGGCRTVDGLGAVNWKVNADPEATVQPMDGSDLGDTDLRPSFLSLTNPIYYHFTQVNTSPLSRG